MACGRAINRLNYPQLIIDGYVVVVHGIGFATLEMLMIDFDVFFWGVILNHTHTLKYSEDIWSSANHGRRR